MAPRGPPPLRDFLACHAAVVSWARGERLGLPWRQGHLGVLRYVKSSFIELPGKGSVGRERRLCSYWYLVLGNFARCDLVGGLVTLRTQDFRRRRAVLTAFGSGPRVVVFAPVLGLDGGAGRADAVKPCNTTYSPETEPPSRRRLESAVWASLHSGRTRSH